MQDDNSLKTTLGTLAFGLALVGVGIWAVVQPDLLADYEPSARNAFFKEAVKWAWGKAGGICSIIAGLAICGIAFLPPEEGK